MTPSAILADELRAAAEGGERMRWAADDAARVCVAHGRELSEYFASSGRATRTVDPVDLLSWLGY